MSDAFCIGKMHIDYGPAAAHFTFGGKSIK